MPHRLHPLHSVSQAVGPRGFPNGDPYPPQQRAGALSSRLNRADDQGNQNPARSCHGDRPNHDPSRARPDRDASTTPCARHRRGSPRRRQRRSRGRERRSHRAGARPASRRWHAGAERTRRPSICGGHVESRVLRAPAGRAALSSTSAGCLESRVLRAPAGREALPSTLSHRATTRWVGAEGLENCGTESSPHPSTYNGSRSTFQRARREVDRRRHSRPLRWSGTSGALRSCTRSRAPPARTRVESRLAYG
jgi:hypothetical protein